MHIQNNAKFKEAKAAAVRAAASFKDGTASRRFRAIEKAIDEIQRNDSIEFDAESRRLTFISLESNKPRVVTEFGCWRECDCLNGISYHRYAYDILARYCALLATDSPNVLRFPMKKELIVSYAASGVTTSLCRNCGECDSISESAPTADVKAFHSRVKNRHEECGSRTPHPHIAAHLARRVAEIEVMNAAQGAGKGWIQDLLVENDSEHYRSEQIDLHYQNTGYAEAA